MEMTYRAPTTPAIQTYNQNNIVTTNVRKYLLCAKNIVSSCIEKHNTKKDRDRKMILVFISRRFGVFLTPWSSENWVWQVKYKPIESAY